MKEKKKNLLFFMLLFSTALFLYFGRFFVVFQQISVVLMTNSLAVSKAEPVEETGKCLEQKHIIFVKTHKTASTGIQNLLLRYGETKSLTFGFPTNQDSHYYVPSDQTFVASAAKPSGPNRTIADILCFHGRADFAEMRKAVPYLDTKIVTILRDPVDQYESLYSYMEYERVMKLSYEEFLKKNILNSTVKAVSEDERTATIKTLRSNFTEPEIRNNYKLQIYLWNAMAYDLGFSYKEMVDKSDTNIDRLIQIIDNHVDLVLIANRMDESLVLLRELLCCSWEDVVIFKKNERPSESKSLFAIKDAQMSDAVRHWNYLDQKLFEYFSNRLEEKIEEYGEERMKADVLKIQESRQSTMETCVDQVVKPKQRSKITDKRLRVPTETLMFQLKDEQKDNLTCIHLAMPERQFLYHLRTVYKEKYGEE